MAKQSVAAEKAAGAIGQAPASRAVAHAAAAAVMGAASRVPATIAERGTPPNVPMVALRTFDYGRQSLDRGQVFRLTGALNDKRMFDLRYFVPLGEDQTTYECAACGCTFVEMSLRDGHAKARHVATRFVPPPAPEREPGESIDTYRNRLDEWAKAAGAAADAADDRRDRLEDELAPLDLTKTAAARA